MNVADCATYPGTNSASAEIKGYQLTVAVTKIYDINFIITMAMPLLWKWSQAIATASLFQDLRHRS
jgi:hypothetical protein